MSASLKGKLIAGFILAFLAGVATGAFFTFHNARHWRTEFGHHPRAFTERMRERVKSQLDLTPEQLAKVEPILDRASKELQKIRAETGAKVRTVAAQTNRSLEPLLSDVQRAKLRKIQERTKQGFRAHKPHRRRGPRAQESEQSDAAD